MLLQGSFTYYTLCKLVAKFGIDERIIFIFFVTVAIIMMWTIPHNVHNKWYDIISFLVINGNMIIHDRIELHNSYQLHIKWMQLTNLVITLTHTERKIFFKFLCCQHSRQSQMIFYRFQYIKIKLCKYGIDFLTFSNRFMTELNKFFSYVI